MLDEARRLMDKGLFTGDISDVMQQMSMDNRCMSPEVKPLASGMRIVGPAVTCHAPAGAYHTILKAFYSARKGDVIVASSGASNIAVMGDFFVRSCMVNGLGGIVTDGCFRDLAAIQKLGFPVFARGITPHAETRMMVGGINVPIQCGGAVVNPGDLIFADGDGVVVLPPERSQEILDRAWNERSSELAQLEKATKLGIAPHELGEIRDPFEKEWNEKGAMQAQAKKVP